MIGPFTACKREVTYLHFKFDIYLETAAGQKAFAAQDGYAAYVLFIAQFEHLHFATIHEEMQPALADMVRHAQQSGVQILAYNCQVTADEVTVKQAIPFDVAIPFEDPIQ